MAEQRHFIPTGNCVEQDAALFADKAKSELARRACATCIQLPYCKEQQAEIAALLFKNGEESPVVGGEVVTPDATIDLSGVEQFSEVTLRFDRSRLPKDGKKALASVQQGFRAGQTYRRSLATIDHPEFNAKKWVLETIKDRNPEVVESLKNTTYQETAEEIGRHILLMSAKRMPSGKFYRTLEKKFENFDPENYYQFALAFMREVAEMAAFTELPQEVKLITFHDTAFYSSYLQAGEKQDIPPSVLRAALKGKPTQPWPYAVEYQQQRRQIDQAANQRLHKAKLAAAAGLDQQGDIERLIDNPAIVEQVKHLLNYRLIFIEDTKAQPIIRLQDHFEALTDVEKAAILRVVGVGDYMPTELKAVIRDHPQAKHIESQVFIALLPALDPEVFVRDQNCEDIRTDIPLLLAVLRREHWANRLTVKNWRYGENEIEKRFLATMPHYDSLTNRQRPVGHRLFVVAHRLLEKRELSLPLDCALQIAEAFAQDTQTLVALGVPETLAPNLALYYSPATYQHIADYIRQNPDISNWEVNKAFYQSLLNPIRFIRQFEKRLTEWEQLPEKTHSFKSSELRMLAYRGITTAELYELSERIKYLEDKLRHVPTFAIKRICLSYSGTTEELVTILKDKSAYIDKFKVQYGERIHIRTMVRLVYYAPPGKEEQVITQRLKAQDKLRDYFTKHPHRDVDDFVIDFMAGSKKPVSVWLVEYQTNLALVHKNIDTQGIPATLLRKLVATHAKDPLRAVRYFQTIQAPFLFDQYIEPWMIEDVFASVLSIGRTALYLRKLRNIFAKGRKFKSLDATSSRDDRTALETIENKEPQTVDSVLVIEQRQELAELIETLNYYERIAVGIVFDLEWIIGAEDYDIHKIYQHFNVADEQALMAHVQQHLLPKMRKQA